jgi:probable rRNA maturation factor
MILRVEVQRADLDVFAPDDDFIRAWVSRALEAAGQSPHVEISVRVVDAKEMRVLNRDYRNKNKPTNVLSFPAGPVAGLPEAEPVPIGDIVVCAEVVDDEAAEQSRPLRDYWAHMLVHGTLHLLGFDHLEDDEAAAMEGLETRILGAHGVADPYGAAAQNC